ncbi:MAG TPA: DinB family protein [Ktedonobacteraceae bacterium]|jgi:hypothetical protein
MTAANAHPTVAAIRQSVQDSYAQLCTLLAGPLATLDSPKLYQTPDENEWSIMQNLAHLCEFLPYWAGQIEQLVAHPGQSFGRTMQDEGRLEALRAHGRDTVLQVKEALPGSYARLDEVLGRLQESDLDLTAWHSKYSERTLAWFIDEFVVEHLRKHIVQLRACLSVCQ